MKSFYFGCIEVLDKRVFFMKRNIQNRMLNGIFVLGSACAVIYIFIDILVLAEEFFPFMKKFHSQKVWIYQDTQTLMRFVLTTMSVMAACFYYIQKYKEVKPYISLGFSLAAFAIYVLSAWALPKI